MAQHAAFKDFFWTLQTGLPAYCEHNEKHRKNGIVAYHVSVREMIGFTL